MDEDRLLSTFLDLVKIDSPSGEEDLVRQYLADRLARLGFDLAVDPAGNLVGRLGAPGTPRLLLNAHMDNVVPCRGVRPVIEAGVIRSDGTTVLGADDKAGLAAILEALECQPTELLATTALEVLFTVGEEVGLRGAKALDPDVLTAPLAIVVDYGAPLESLVVAAPAQDSLDVIIHGRAAHAGVYPELGISAIAVAARAIARMPLGRIDEETTANVGTIQGGSARNIVPEQVSLLAEARSHDEEKLRLQTLAMTTPLEEEAHAAGARLELDVRRSYPSFRLSEDAPVVRLIQRGAAAVGLEMQLKRTGGGSDANILNARGIPTAIIGTGYHDPHTTGESLPIADLSRATTLLSRIIALV